LKNHSVIYSIYHEKYHFNNILLLFVEVSGKSREKEVYAKELPAGEK